VFFSEGVSKGRITVNEFVALSATNHAKMYGLYPQKGSIGVGFDADIALWDPNRKETIRQEILHHGADYTPWEGFEVTGWPVMTIAGGEIVAQHGKLSGTKGRGRVLSRNLSPYAAPAA
jgi:dihydropyrimidinase